MKITCEQCTTQHELEPPAWVVASGRAFRFRCSSCGHSQMVSPAKAPPPPTPVPVETMPRAMTPAPAPEATRPDAPPIEGTTANNGAVYLKQDGKVYLVRDWATVQRWIMERRVDRTDLISEGGVRWEPIGTRPELGSFFLAIERLEAVEQGHADGPRADVPFPFAHPSEPGALRRFGQLDDDTEGVPLGLPPLPTEEVALLGPGPGATPVSSDEGPAVRRAQLKVPTPEPAPERFSDFMSHGTPLPVAASNDDFALPPMMRTPTPAPMESRRMATIPPPALMPTPEPAPDRSAVEPTQSDETLDPDPDGPMDVMPSHEGSAEWTDEAPAPRRSPWLPIAIVGALLAVVVGGLAGLWYTQRQHPAPKAPEAGLGEAIGPAHTTPAAASTPAHPTPAEGHEATPAEGHEATPAEGHEATPAAGHEATPAAGHEATAAAGHEATAAAGHEATPAAGHEATPAHGSSPTPAKTPTPTPTPAKSPTPTPTPAGTPKPASPSSKSLVEQGWAAVEKSNWTAAAGAFQKALGVKAGDPAASLGLGYVLLKQGDRDGAKPHLCRAARADGADAREAAGLLAANDLTCP